MPHNVSFKEGEEGETASEEDQIMAVLKTKQMSVHPHLCTKVLAHAGATWQLWPHDGASRGDWAPVEKRVAFCR